MLWEPRLRAVDVAQLDVLEERFFFYIPGLRLFFFLLGVGVWGGGWSHQRGEQHKMMCGDENMPVIL